jgi:hypothetical protein
MRSRCILFALCFFAVSAGVAWGEVLPQIDRPAAAVGQSAQAHRVRMATLFGHATSASAIRDDSVNHAEAFRFVEQMSGTAQGITVFVPVHSTAKSLVVGLYSDRGGDPGSLLASNSQAIPAAGGWVTAPIKNTPLQKSTTYWTAVLGKGGRLDTRNRESASCMGTIEAKRDLSALPQSWGRGVRFTDCLAAYVIGRPGAAGPGATSTPTTTTATLATGLPSAGVTLPLPPINTSAPTISGTPQQGQTLTASTGSWADSPTSYAYQWQDCGALLCTDISNATSSTYTLQGSDVGSTIDVIVTASNAAGSFPAASSRTATVASQPAPGNTALPTISGTAQQGDTLIASNGSWTNNPTSFAYQWQDCATASSCSNISGATSSSYSLRSTDVGKTIDVVVSATNAGGSTPATSAQTQAVTAPPPAKPVNTSAPTISGTAQQGDAVTASNGSWSNSPTSYAYQWQDCTSASSCSNISGATSSSYTLQSTDVGKTIDVVVTATNAGGSTSATSTQTGAVTASGGSGGSGLSPLHVVGNTLVNGNGQQIVLHGTDVSGSSYACESSGGYGFSDTPTGNSLYSAMVGNDGGSLSKNWTINSVTLGINQDCWLGINGVKAQYSGQNYINYVKSEVTSMESYGIYPVITFFVGEPGTDTPNWSSTGNGNAPMPDNDHVPLVWEEMANTFKSDPDVIFRLYEEPWPESTGTNLATWQCWSQGDVQYGTGSDSTLPGTWQSSPGTQTAPSSTSSTEHCNPLNKDSQGTAYSSVGMQSLVNIIRGTGAQNIIQIPGVAFANMLSCTSTESPTSCGFLDSADGVRVNDPLSSSDPSLGAQLVADTDNYPDQGQDCGSLTCVTDTYGPVEQVMPIDMGEAGVENNSDAFPLIEQFIDQYDTWHQSYYGSQWESWADLITNYNGTPDSGWGTWYYDHITGAG